MFLDLSNMIVLWPWPCSRYHREVPNGEVGGGARGPAERKKGREEGEGGGSAK